MVITEEIVVRIVPYFHFCYSQAQNLSFLSLKE